MADGSAPAGTLIPDEVRRFLSREPPWFGTIATLDPDGRPHQAIVWYLVSHEGIVVNSAEGRRWPGNLRRDPRASISIGEAYDFVMLRGSVDVIDDPERAQADIAAMARRYHADDPAEAEDMIANRFRKQRRVSFLLRPDQLHVHLDD